MDPPIPEPDPPHDAWREIQQLIAEVARAAREGAAPNDFLGLLVDRSLRATGATAAVVWTLASGGRFQPEFHRHAQNLRLAEDRHAQALHARLLESAPRADGTTWVPAGAGETSSDPHAPLAGYVNREWTLSFTPLRVDSEVFAVLELAHPELEDPSLQQACEEIIDAFAAAASNWQRARQTADWRRQAEFFRGCEQFARRIHAPLVLTDTLLEIVNETRVLLGCDRVAVAMGTDGEWRVAAVSGLEKVDRRSPVIEAIEPLVAVVARLGEPLWCAGTSHDLPPELAQPLDRFLDAAHSRELALVPLYPPRADGPSGRELEPLGMLILEWIATTASNDARDRAERLVPHVALALGNAWEHGSVAGLAWLRPWRTLTGNARRRRRRRLRIAALASVAAAILLLCPIPFTISARGTLRPALVREVFATADGEVARLHVSAEQMVERDEPLLELHSPPLDLERERLRGELETMRERLLAAESARLTGDDTRRETSEASLSASESELRRALESIEAQLAIVEGQRQALHIGSPLRGAVLDSNLMELLEARPVRQGQALLAVGDVHGAWEARVDILDQRVGHILAARATRDEPLDVTFVLATAPGIRYRGQLQRLDAITGHDPEGRPSVKGYVTFDRAQPIPLRPGATVIAKIHCGYRPLGYVWFHELFEFLQARLLL